MERIGRDAGIVIKMAQNSVSATKQLWNKLTSLCLGFLFFKKELIIVPAS